MSWMLTYSVIAWMQMQVFSVYIEFIVFLASLHHNNEIYKANVMHLHWLNFMELQKPPKYVVMMRKIICHLVSIYNENIVFTCGTSTFNTINYLV